jgi:L-ascorbate metabolism protein UlaG (beta-lactamase superfamily)
MPRNPYYVGPATDHFDGTRFFNPGQPSTDRSLAEVLRWQATSTKARWPAAVDTALARPNAEVHGLAATFVGHASVLLQLGGQNILIDPVWSERASPVQWAGPKRVTRPGIAFDDLPPIHLVLVTHNHYDHMDRPTLQRLQQAHRPRFVAPLGNDTILRGFLGRTAAIDALDWHDTLDLDGLAITAVPANHWSSRTGHDRRMALWSGFMVRAAGRLVYNVGDTGYGDGSIFRDLRTRYGSPDLAIIPIGAYEPRWFMADQHVDPAEAVRIFRDCGAAQALGTHWGTFQLTDEACDAPRAALADALTVHGIDPAQFIALEAGQRWTGDR